MMVTHTEEKGHAEVPKELSRAAYKYAKAHMGKRVRTEEDVQRFRGYAVEYLRRRLSSLSDQQLGAAVAVPE